MRLIPPFLYLMLLCFVRLTHAEEVVLEDAQGRAVFDRQTAALRELKCEERVIPIGAPGARLLVQDFPDGAVHALTAESCEIADRRVKCGPPADLTCELNGHREPHAQNRWPASESDRSRRRCAHLRVAARGRRPSVLALSTVSRRSRISRNRVRSTAAAVSGNTAAGAFAIPPASPCSVRWSPEGKLGIAFVSGFELRDQPLCRCRQLLAAGLCLRSDRGFQRRAAAVLRRLSGTLHPSRPRDGTRLRHTRAEEPDQYGYNETLSVGDLNPTIQPRSRLRHHDVPLRSSASARSSTSPPCRELRRSDAAYCCWTPEATRSPRDQREHRRAGCPFARGSRHVG